MAHRAEPRHVSARFVAALGCALALASLASAGCGVASIGPDTCDRSGEGNPPVRYTEGTVEDGIYMSSSWEGELLYFPGGMRYLIEHKLGEVPRYVQFYLSFDRCGTMTGVIAPAAGNQVELRGIDETTLTVVNGSCVEYWLLAVAGAGPAPGPQDAGPSPSAPDAGVCTLD